MTSYDKVSSLKDFIDPFITLRKLFVDFGYNRITKIVNKFCLLVQSFILLIQVYYVINNFSLDIFGIYAYAVTFTAYVTVVMLISIIQEQNIWERVDEISSSFWSIECAGHQAKETMLNKVRKIKILNYSDLHFLEV
ncbi:hypothetical protein BDFB_011466 [Asbolus verrucosus]|uniref:7tm 6 domain containing protein n=1 Tax=Asbolus verrucosus TaxID=1661398 RepID=A0A482VFC3_ASBVE|nr:hypothetical protein BDFB_011466 [Asbolus verrucosus]